jgi:hypothetical protein
VSKKKGRRKEEGKKEGEVRSSYPFLAISSS